MACYRRKSTVWPGKLISSKKTPKNGLFQQPNIGITSLWEDLEAKLFTPCQLLGFPLKLWGITVQTSYVDGRLHQNWAYTSLPSFFFNKIIFILTIVSCPTRLLLFQRPENRGSLIHHHHLDLVKQPWSGPACPDPLSRHHLCFFCNKVYRSWISMLWIIIIL